MDEQQKARLEELRLDRVRRDKEARDAAELRELEREELERQLEQQTGGKRGDAFELVDSKVGLFAVIAPDDAGVMNWDKAKPEQRQDLDWMIQFLRKYIVPKERALEWAQKAAMKSALCWDTSTAFVSLLGANVDALTKK